MGKYRSFSTQGGRTVVDLDTGMIAAVASREADLRKATDSKEVFAKLEGHCVTITAKALNSYMIVGKFSMEQLPGCCGVAVSYHAQIETQFRGRGIGGLFLEMREDAAKRAGYTMVLATVLADNEVENKLLGRHGWIAQKCFKNRRTGHGVAFWMKELEFED